MINSDNSLPETSQASTAEERVHDITKERHALELRAEVINLVAGRKAERKGLSDRLEIGIESATDTAYGKEELHVGGGLSEEANTAETTGLMLSMTVYGKLNLNYYSDTLITAGGMLEQYTGGEVIAAGMSDNLLGGGGIRIRGADLRMNAASVMEEKVSTLAIDGLVAECCSTACEREEGNAIYSVGFASYKGTMEVLTGTTIRPMCRALFGVRTKNRGGGGGSGGDSNEPSPEQPPTPAEEPKPPPKPPRRTNILLPAAGGSPGAGLYSTLEPEQIGKVLGGADNAINTGRTLDTAKQLEELQNTESFEDLRQVESIKGSIERISTTGVEIVEPALLFDPSYLERTTTSYDSALNLPQETDSITTVTPSNPGKIASNVNQDDLAKKSKSLVDNNNVEKVGLSSDIEQLSLSQSVNEDLQIGVGKVERTSVKSVYNGGIEKPPLPYRINGTGNEFEIPSIDAKTRQKLNITEEQIRIEGNKNANQLSTDPVNRLLPSLPTMNDQSLPPAPSLTNNDAKWTSNLSPVPSKKKNKLLPTSDYFVIKPEGAENSQGVLKYSDQQDLAQKAARQGNFKQSGKNKKPSYTFEDLQIQEELEKLNRENALIKIRDDSRTIGYQSPILRALRDNNNMLSKIDVETLKEVDKYTGTKYIEEYDRIYAEKFSKYTEITTQKMKTIIESYGNKVDDIENMYNGRARALKDVKEALKNDAYDFFSFGEMFRNLNEGEYKRGYRSFAYEFNTNKLEITSHRGNTTGFIRRQQDDLVSKFKDDAMKRFDRQTENTAGEVTDSYLKQFNKIPTDKIMDQLTKDAERGMFVEYIGKMDAINIFEKKMNNTITSAEMFSTLNKKIKNLEMEFYKAQNGSSKNWPNNVKNTDELSSYISGYRSVFTSVMEPDNQYLIIQNSFNNTFKKRIDNHFPVNTVNRQQVIDQITNYLEINKTNNMKNTLYELLNRARSHINEGDDPIYILAREQVGLEADVAIGKITKEEAINLSQQITKAKDELLSILSKQEVQLTRSSKKKAYLNSFNQNAVERKFDVLEGKDKYTYLDEIYLDPDRKIFFNKKNKDLTPDEFENKYINEWGDSRPLPRVTERKETRWHKVAEANEIDISSKSNTGRSWKELSGFNPEANYKSNSSYVSTGDIYATIKPKSPSVNFQQFKTERIPKEVLNSSKGVVVSHPTLKQPKFYNDQVSAIQMSSGNPRKLNPTFGNTTQDINNLFPPPLPEKPKPLLIPRRKT